MRTCGVTTLVWGSHYGLHCNWGSRLGPDNAGRNCVPNSVPRSVFLFLFSLGVLYTTNSQSYWKLGHSLNCMWMWISSSCFKVKDAISYSDVPFVQLLSLGWQQRREFAVADSWFLITVPVLASATCRPWQPTSAEMTRAAQELSPQQTQSTQMHTVIKLNLEKSSIILKGGCLVPSSQSNWAWHWPLIPPYFLCTGPSESQSDTLSKRPNVILQKKKKKKTPVILVYMKGMIEGKSREKKGLKV